MEPLRAIDPLLCISASFVLLPLALFGLLRIGGWVLSKTGPRYISPTLSGTAIDTEKLK